MQDKNKITLYIPSELHRKLKIRAAVDSEPMSAIAEKAIGFYLTHSSIVDDVESSHGSAHRIYTCPECTGQLVLREGEMESLGNQPGVVDEDLSVGSMQGEGIDPSQNGRGELVPC